MREIITQIGSLPYTDIEEAVQYSLKHDIPFLPELSLIKGDSMSEYIHNPGNLACLERFKQETYDIVKIQCIGPITLLSDPSLNINSEKEAEDITSRHIYGIINNLKAKEIILFLDEPSLGHSGMNFQKEWDKLFYMHNFTTGVHICSLMDWDRLFSSSIDIISFDASMYDLTIYPLYKKFRERGGRIAWGIRNLEDIKDFIEGDLITLPCGMSHIEYKPKDCYPTLKKLQDISYKLLP